MASVKDRKCKRCPTMVYRDSITGLCAECLNKDRAARKPDELLKTDREIARLREELGRTGKLLKASESDVKRLTKELHLTNEVDSLEINPIIIEPKQPSGKAEGTAVMNLSDWHCEERVDPATISYQNIYNLDLAAERAKKCFRSGLRLIRLLQQDIKINTAVIGLLGDFITNADMHQGQQAEACMLEPTEAIEFAQNLLIGGLEFILENSDLNLVIPCHSGNHGRTTPKVRFGHENGHSLEYLMYRSIEKHLTHKYQERVDFRVSKGYHSYAEIYGQKARFHHGHAINYQGGIGGIFIPAFKAISQWDKMRQADVDFFGHFHQHKDGSKFVSNGSLIGFNSYALSIKADYEKPKQTLTLFDKERGRTCTWPILFTK